MIEKILARAGGRKEVVPGDVVIARVDRMLMHDLSAHFVTRVFREELAGGRIADPDRIAFVFDHTFSAPTREAAEKLHMVRRFAREHGIRHFFDGGHGSLHHVIIENGLWAPGQIIIGCDSHTPIFGALGCFATGVGNNSMAALGFQHGLAWFRIPETMQIKLEGKTRPGVSARDIAQYVVGYLGEDGAVYKAIEYAGPYIEEMSIQDRTLFPLMSIDLGAKAAFINPDARTREFARLYSSAADPEMVVNDPEVQYASVIEIDVSDIPPQLACPPTVGNVKPVAEVAGIPVDLAEVGGSTGGRLEDLRILAEVMTGKKVHTGTRLQVVPASRGIYRAAIREGLMETLLDAGAIICPPGAGSNQAVNMGAICAQEVMISNQARNFPGRNGDPNARHYLGSALTVALSALHGEITAPAGQ